MHGNKIQAHLIVYKYNASYRGQLVPYLLILHITLLVYKILLKKCSTINKTGFSLD